MSTLPSQHVHSWVTAWQGFNCTYSVFHLTLCVHHVSTKSRAPAKDPAQGYCNTHIQQSPKSFTNQFINITMYTVWSGALLGLQVDQSRPNSTSDTQYLTAGVICCKRYTFLQQEVWFVFQYNMYVPNSTSYNACITHAQWCMYCTNPLLWHVIYTSSQECFHLWENGTMCRSPALCKYHSKFTSEN